MTPCDHTTYSPHTSTSAPTPITATPTHNRFSALYQEYEDTYDQVQSLGRLAALEPPVVNSVMNIGCSKYRLGSVKLKVMGYSGAADCVLPDN